VHGLPRILGVLMALAGLGWLTFLSPLVPSFQRCAITFIVSSLNLYD
jgi:hypothetical protein